MQAIITLIKIEDITPTTYESLPILLQRGIIRTTATLET